MTVFVLVHGAGHTADVWGAVKKQLRHESVAVNLPGRRDRQAPIAAVTIEAAATSVAADVEDATDDRVVLVGHSAGGVVLPALAACLAGRVDHLVFVAGLCARDRERVITAVRPEAEPELPARMERTREEFADAMLDPDRVGGRHRARRGDRDADRLVELHEPVRVLACVPPELPRPSCAHSAIGSNRAGCRRGAASRGATSVIDIDCGHTPALARPAELAAILDGIGDRVDATDITMERS